MAAAVLELLFGCDADMAQHRAGELGEETLDEIKPGAVLGREDEFEAAGRLLREPSLGLLGDVRRMIVEDQLDRRMARIGGVEELEEFNEFAAAVAVLNESVDLAGEQIDAGQQADRAVALVLVVAREGRMSEARHSGNRHDRPGPAARARHSPTKGPVDQTLHKGATRFGAAVGCGLTAYVGREREMDILERGFAEARSQLHVIDIMAEPGMGKSRLLHEFRQRVGKEHAFILSGSCSPDGQQTPFLPFIEVVRSSFQVSAGEAENEVVRKLEMGLTVLGLHSPENLGLLLNLLGLKPPEGALTGLDGLLIGLRTRDLLQQLLEARCRLSPVVLLLEDLHWIDSVSEEVLGRIIDGEAELRLLLLHTRRPEYHPSVHSDQAAFRAAGGGRYKAFGPGPARS